MSSFTPPRFIIVDGNIGAGKSSLLRIAGHAFGQKVKILCEPTHRWTNHYCSRTKQVHNFLEMQNKEPRAAFVVQSFIMNTMIRQVSEISDDVRDTDKFVLMERGPLSCLEVFTEAAYAQGRVLDSELAVLYDQGTPFIKVMGAMGNPKINRSKTIDFAILVHAHSDCWHIVSSNIS